MSGQEQLCGCDSKEISLDKLDAILKKWAGYHGALIPVMQEAQEAYGYLPKEVIRGISKGLDVPTSQIFGVATFYAQFHMEPRGKNIVRVCQGTACHVRGAKAILESVEKNLGVKPGKTTPDLKFTLETVACIGCCGLAPVMMVNDDTHARLKPDKIKGILEAY